MYNNFVHFLIQTPLGKDLLISLIAFRKETCRVISVVNISDDSANFPLQFPRELKKKNSRFLENLRLSLTFPGIMSTY